MRGGERGAVPGGPAPAPAASQRGGRPAPAPLSPGPPSVLCLPIWPPVTAGSVATLQPSTGPSSRQAPPDSGLLLGPLPAQTTSSCHSGPASFPPGPQVASLSWGHFHSANADRTVPSVFIHFGNNGFPPPPLLLLPISVEPSQFKKLPSFES